MKLPNIWTTAGAQAKPTPTSRNRYADFLRAASILAVVIGHGLGAAPQLTDDGLEVARLLEVAPWTHYLTWVLQVMPIFFFVGGYANAAGWRAARRDAVTYGAWLRARLRRLLLPVLPLLAVWALGAPIAVAAGLDPDLLSIASLTALIPLWFLATYAVVITIVPLSLLGWERRGWLSVVVPVAAAILVDVANIAWKMPYVGFLNFVLVWGSIHQLGYGWADNRWGPVSRRTVFGLIGLAALAALVHLGPYPVAMVGVDTNQINNTFPPNITLFALGLCQVGLLLSVEPQAQHWLAGRRPWTATIAINSSIMTLYLWHMSALVVVTGTLVGLGGVGIKVPINSGIWWLTRPLWLALLALVILPFLAIFGRFERPGPDLRLAPPAWRPLLAVVGLCCGVTLLAFRGVIDETGLNWVALLFPVVGVAVGGVGGARLAARAGRMTPTT